MIEGKTSAEIAEKVRAVPLENRRIILYTGVHPHEGTSGLAAQHEKEWTKHSVLIVAHPMDNTPHGIWAENKRRNNGKFQPLDPNIKIDENEFEEQITGGDPTVVVRFHGTPIRAEDKTRKITRRKLEILPSMKTDQCLDPNLFATLNQYFHNVEHLGYPPNRICVEYWYKGDGEIPTTDEYTMETLRNLKLKHDNNVPKIFLPNDENWWNKANLYPDYLVQPKLSIEDVREFHEVHATTLGYLLEHIHTALTKQKPQ